MATENSRADMHERSAAVADRVYIVVLNWNRWQLTVKCLDALTALEFGPLTVLVCDNGSKDGSLAHLASWGAGSLRRDWAFRIHEGGPLGQESGNAIVLVDNQRNLGFAGGCNVGIRLAMAQQDRAYVWLLNNDTVVEPDSLSAMVAMCRADPSIGICGSQIRYAARRDRVQSQGGLLNPYFCTTHLLSDHPVRAASDAIDFVPGASMLVSRAYLDHVGPMAEEYFLYFEEIDWAERGKRHFRFAVCPDSVVYHVGGASIGNASESTDQGLRADWYLLRGRLLFARKFYKRFLVLVYGGMCVSILKRVVRGDFRRALVATYALINRPVPWLTDA